MVILFQMLLLTSDCLKNQTKQTTERTNDETRDTLTLSIGLKKIGHGFDIAVSRSTVSIFVLLFSFSGLLYVLFHLLYSYLFSK